MYHILWYTKKIFFISSIQSMNYYKWWKSKKTIIEGSNRNKQEPLANASMNVNRFWSCWDFLIHSFMNSNSSLTNARKTDFCCCRWMFQYLCKGLFRVFLVQTLWQFEFGWWFQWPFDSLSIESSKPKKNSSEYFQKERQVIHSSTRQITFSRRSHNSLLRRFCTKSATATTQN